MKKIIFLASLFLFLSGCYNIHELENLNVVATMSINFQNNNYLIEVETIEKNNFNCIDSFLSKGTGKTIYEALDSIIKTNENSLYLKNLQIVLIEENTFKEKLKEINTFFLTNNDIGNNFNILLLKNTSLETLISFDKSIVLGEELVRLINNQTFYKNNPYLKWFDVLKKIYEDEVLILPILNIQNNKFSIEEASIFEGTKFRTNLNDKDIKNYNLLKENISNLPIQVKCSNDNFINMIILQSKIQTNLQNVVSNLKGKILSNNCKLNFTEVQKLLEKEISERLNTFISIKNIGNILFKNNQVNKFQVHLIIMEEDKI